MQKTHHLKNSRTAAMLMLAASLMPATIYAGDSGFSYSGLAQREIARRQQATGDADRLLDEGRTAYAKGDYQQAVTKFRTAVDSTPNSEAFSDRRAAFVKHLSDASVALAQQYRKSGKYTESRTLLEAVLASKIDPTNALARQELGYLDDPIRTNPALTYEHSQNVDKVRQGLYTAEGAYNLGKYDQAYKEYQNVLRVDPYNTAARRGMEQINQAKSNHYRAAYDENRSRMLAEVDAAWANSIPQIAPNLPTGGTLNNGGDEVYITEKLRRIIIPKLDLDNVPVEEAVDLLRQRAMELDSTEVDPTRKGVNFIVRRNAVSASSSAPSVLPVEGEASAPASVAAEPGTGTISNLHVRNLPLEVVLRYICDQAKLRYKVDDYSVMLVPLNENVEDLSNRTFQIPPGFTSAIQGGAGAAEAAPAADPFASDSATTAGSISRTPPITELLKSAGIKFEKGSSATLSNGTLIVTNTVSQLDALEALIGQIGSSAPKQVKITTKFVEISQDNSEELGFDWIIDPFGLNSNMLLGGGSLGNQGLRTASDFISTVNGTTLKSTINGQVSGIATGGLRSGDFANRKNSIDAVLNSSTRNAQNQSVAPGILGLTHMFNHSQVQMMMRGLSQKKGVDLMTAPSVTARSGQKAKIEIIREFIYPTEYEPPELPQSVGSTGNNGGNGLLDGLTGGGSSGGSFPVTPATPTAFETKNTGVTLEIEPSITNDVVVDVKFIPQIIEFEGFVNYGSPIQTTSTSILGQPITNVITENRIEMPIFSVRRVDTALTIYDGYTVAVGGLMREDVQNIEDKVPILGDIPYVGRLFQSKSEYHKKSNLIIFVTADIIDATGTSVKNSGAGISSAAATPISTDGGVLPPIDLPK